MADKKDNTPEFDPSKDFRARAGNQVTSVVFPDKIMGVIHDRDGEDGQFCSWSKESGRRIGMSESNGDHPQDLVNVEEVDDVTERPE